MKKIGYLGRNLCGIAVAAMLTLSAHHIEAVTLSVVPSAVSNTYIGTITLQVGGLTNGETVAVEYYGDMNGDGVLDNGDWLQQKLELTDGRWPTIGGVANINMPGDTSGVDGSITSVLGMFVPQPQWFVGTHFIRLASPSGNFPPVIQTFVITNWPFAQTVSGNVTSSSTNVPFGVVVALSPSTAGNGGDLVTGTTADNTGHYSLHLPPGTYQLLAVRPGYVFNAGTAPLVSLAANDNVIQDLELATATQTLAGRVVDEVNTNLGLPGLFMTLESASGLLAVTGTDPDGYFNVPVVPDVWKVGPDSSGLLPLGYLEPQNRPHVDTTTGSVSTAMIVLPKGTAMFYGSIKNETNAPLVGVGFYDNDNNGMYESSGFSAPDGSYCAVALPGTWQISLDNNNPSLSDYVVAGSVYGAALSSNQAYRADFTATHATASISGTVKDSSGTPVAGLMLYAYCTSGTSYNSGATTDAQGRFSMGAINGSWNVGIPCGNDYGLKSMGYDCIPNDRSVVVSSANAEVDFIVYPLGTPVLRGPVRTGPTQFSFWLDAASGYNYYVQVSTNLANPSAWATLFSTNLPQDSIFIQDNQAPAGRRFYRAIRY